MVTEFVLSWSIRGQCVLKAAMRFVFTAVSRSPARHRRLEKGFSLTGLHPHPVRGACGWRSRLASRLTALLPRIAALRRVVVTSTRHAAVASVEFFRALRKGGFRMFVVADRRRLSILVLGKHWRIE